MGLLDTAVAEEESFLLLSKYVKQLLIKLSFHICVEMQILFLMLIFYSFCSSTEIIAICNKNVLIELIVYFFPVVPYSRCENAGSYCRTNNTSAMVKHSAGCSCKLNRHI